MKEGDIHENFLASGASHQPHVSSIRFRLPNNLASTIKFHMVVGKERETMREKMSNVAAIREYFSTGKHGRKVEMQELKALSLEDREELGSLARKELEREG